jgi:hypothetical protein
LPYSLKVTDKAGNSVTKNISIFVDDTAPEFGDLYVNKTNPIIITVNIRNLIIFLFFK